MNEQKETESVDHKDKTEEAKRNAVSPDEKSPAETEHKSETKETKLSAASPNHRSFTATNDKAETKKIKTNMREKVAAEQKPVKVAGKAKKFAIAAGIVMLGIGLCVITDCFIDMQVQPSSTVVEITEKKDYTTLINQWNSAVLAADLNKSFELPRGNNRSAVKKLDSLFEQTMKPESFKKQNECVLKGNKKIFIPSLEYMNFLKENDLQYTVHFTSEDSEDVIIQELKKTTGSKYIDYKMLNKVAYLNSFELFFEKNKKRFYKDGFSQYIKDFDTYQVAVERCK